MYLAALLWAYNIPLKKVNKQDPRRQVFEFEGLPSSVFILEDDQIASVPVSGIENLKVWMLGEKLMFPPRFIVGLRTIKSLLHDE